MVEEINITTRNIEEMFKLRTFVWIFVFSWWIVLIKSIIQQSQPPVVIRLLFLFGCFFIWFANLGFPFKSFVRGLVGWKR